MKSSTIGLTVAAAVLTLTACAHSPDKISTSYVSPLTYSSYDCDQLAMEANYVTKKATQLHASLDKKANNDAVAMGVGMILFWPALFALSGGDGPEAAEYAEVKGRADALQREAIAKKCGYRVAEFTPPQKPTTSREASGFQVH